VTPFPDVSEHIISRHALELRQRRWRNFEIEAANREIVKEGVARIRLALFPSRRVGFGGRAAPAMNEGGAEQDGEYLTEEAGFYQKVKTRL
jgi:hypothetical protein